MRVLRVLLVAAMAVLAAAAAGCTDPPPYRDATALPPGASPPSGPDAGKVLYARDCAWCHGGAGKGTRVAPGIDRSGAAATDFYLSTGRMPLRDPNRAVHPGKPAYSSAEIEAITGYVASFGEGPEIPALGASSGVARGADLYEQNCAACHGSSGTGGALTSGVEAPTVLENTAVQVVEAIRIGPGTMPVFDKASMNDPDAAAIAEYIGHLQEPQQQGGLSLGRIGPIAEGAVGIIVGLGALMIVCRAIGKRADE